MHKVYKLLKKVPKGKVTTYGALAKAVGLHPRQVAALMRKNRNPEIHCHRVVMSDGRIGGYNRGVKTKIKLLMKEGIKIVDGKIRNFKNSLFFFQ